MKKLLLLACLVNIFPVLNGMSGRDANALSENVGQLIYHCVDLVKNTGLFQNTKRTSMQNSELISNNQIQTAKSIKVKRILEEFNNRLFKLIFSKNSNL